MNESRILRDRIFLLDWDDYKSLCDSPTVMTRWAIENTRRLVAQPDAREALDETLDGQPVEKPVDHTGDADTDCFCLEVPAALAQVIVSELDGSADRRTRHLAIVWGEYLDAITR